MNITSQVYHEREYKFYLGSYKMALLKQPDKHALYLLKKLAANRNISILARASPTHCLFYKKYSVFKINEFFLVWFEIFKKNDKA